MAQKRYSYYDRYYYPKTSPIATKGGMKIKAKRGEIGSQWWSKRLLEILSSYGWSTRLQRGRSYARNGQVLRINIEKNQIVAEVQGSSRNPYSISITFPPISDASWKIVLSSIAKKPEITSKLLIGEIPPELEEAFKSASSPLFPTKSKDIDMMCSCPDYAIPCKHIAAVFYVFADSLNENPFLLFQLRGKSKDEIMQAVVSTEPTTIQEKSPAKNAITSSIPQNEIHAFWNWKNIDVKMVDPEIQGVVPPLKKYPLPSDFDDETVQAILQKYYEQIKKSVMELKA